MHKLFSVSIVLKGLNGLAEIVLGLLAVFITHQSLIYGVNLITRLELLEDPGDVFANYLITAATQYSFDTQIFIAAYLLIHGVLKVGLVWALLKRKLWAYPSAITVFGLFFIYQVYEYIKAPQISLVVLSVLDLFVIFLTYFEYRSMKKTYTKASVPSDN